MEVFAAHSARVEGVPTGGHGSKGLYVIAVVAGIEDEITADGLEESEITGCGLWILEDIILGYVFLVGKDETHNAVAYLCWAELHVALYGHGLVLKCYLAHRQLAYALAVVIAFDAVARRHGGIVGIHGDSLGGVYCHIDDMTRDAQTVKFGIGTALAAE